MHRMLLGAIALLTSLSPAVADAAPSKDSAEIWQTAEVEIAADGRVTMIRWLDDRPAARLVSTRIEPHVRTWRFEPGTVDGEPRVTRTYLRAQLFADVRGDGMALRIGRVSTGPHATHRVMPRYPGSAARAGVSAKVTATITVMPDGGVVFDSLDFWRPAGRSAQKEEFIEATRAALAQWKYAPESVGGRDIPPQVRIPVEFCAPGTHCEKLFRGGELVGSAAADRPGEATPLNSVARLLTSVEGDTI